MTFVACLDVADGYVAVPLVGVAGLVGAVVFG